MEERRPEVETPAAEVAPAAPVAAQPVTPKPQPSAVRPKLAGSISIGSIAVPAPKQEAPLQAEVKPLTQEDLERYWKEAGDELGLSNLLSEATVSLGEHTGRIEIDALSVSFSDEFKPHRTDVMQLLRKKASMPMLDCRVTPKFVESKALLYSPTEKYNAMLQRNPQLQELRKLFPQIDY